MKTAFLNSLMYLHLACIVLLCLPSVGFAQHGASVPKPPKAAKLPSARELADLHYTAKHYAKALPYLLEYQKEKPRDIETKERIGRCFLEMALPERAQPYFETLTEGKTPRTDIYPDLAKAHHLQGHYEEAIKYYKLAIANLDTKNPQREALKAEVARCARAIKMAYATQRGYVENLGEAINSADDEFAPIVPSNAESLMFFSAIHERNVGGYHDNEGKPDPKGILTADIYESMISQGEWQPALHLGASYNTVRDDQVCDLSEDRVYFYLQRDNQKDKGYLAYAPFYPNDSLNDPNLAQRFNTPINSPAFDGDAFFFRDSVVLFSSDRSGGYGGRDLYIVHRNASGQWDDPINLGAAVNTPYDEVSPFLSYDGRTLYFSSNNPTTAGGFDIFRTRFVDSLKAWTVPENLNFPLNSPADDTHFRLSKDGMRGYFDSNRMGGRGGRDIYVAYFKKFAPEQVKSSRPAAFSDLLKGKSIADAAVTVIEENTTSSDTKERRDSVLARIDIAPMLYTDANILQLPANQSEMNNLATLLVKFRKIQVELTAHSDDDGLPNVTRYFSAKRLDELSNFLIQKGVSPDRILLKSCGLNYPIAQNRSQNGNPNDIGRSLNRRIEIRLINPQASGVAVQYQYPDISAELLDLRGASYRQSLQGLTYKIQIKATKQLLDDPILKIPDAMIEVVPNTGLMRYTVGLYNKLVDATTILSHIREQQGFSDAYIVAYIDGQRIAPEQLKEFITTFPELKALQPK